MHSILISVKLALGIDQDYSGFDTQVTMLINSALLSLNQLGIGPEEGVTVTGIGEEWSLLLVAETDIEAIKAFVYLKTKLGFDPPSTSFVLNAMERQIEQLEWRLMAQVEEPVT